MDIDDIDDEIDPEEMSMLEMLEHILGSIPAYLLPEGVDAQSSYEEVVAGTKRRQSELYQLFEKHGRCFIDAFQDYKKDADGWESVGQKPPHHRQILTMAAMAAYQIWSAEKMIELRKLQPKNTPTQPEDPSNN